MAEAQDNDWGYAVFDAESAEGRAEAAEKKIRFYCVIIALRIPAYILINLPHAERMIDLDACNAPGGDAEAECRVAGVYQQSDRSREDVTVSCCLIISSNFRMLVFEYMTMVTDGLPGLPVDTCKDDLCMSGPLNAGLREPAAGTHLAKRRKRRMWPHDTEFRQRALGKRPQTRPD